MYSHDSLQPARPSRKLQRLPYGRMVSALLPVAILLLTGGLISDTAHAQQAPGVSTIQSEGDRLFQQNDFAGAANAYRHFLDRHQSDAAAGLGLVRSLLRQDQWEQAIKEAESFVHRCPTVADAHGILAFAYERGGRFDEAEKEAQQALQLLMQFRRVLIDYPHRKLILESSLYRDPNQKPQPRQGGAWIWLTDHWEWGAYNTTIQERGKQFTFPADPNAQSKP